MDPIGAIAGDGSSLALFPRNSGPLRNGLGRSDARVAQMYQAVLADDQFKDLRSRVEEAHEKTSRAVCEVLVARNCYKITQHSDVPLRFGIPMLTR